MKLIFDLIAAIVVGAYGKVMHRVKTEMTAVYVSSVEHARRAFIGAFIAMLGVLLGVCGFLLVHVALYLYLPWSAERKSLTLLGLGLAYLVVAVAGIARLLSRSFWLKHSKAQDMLDSLAEKK